MLGADLPPAIFHAWEHWRPIAATQWAALFATVADWLLLASARAVLNVHGTRASGEACDKQASSFSKTATVAANRSVFDQFCMFRAPGESGAARGLDDHDGGSCSWKPSLLW